ncbi:Trk system potassium transporter TrkA [Peptoniphilus sp. GNH]|nr:putative potassium transporter peripheral membrane component [Clostridiales bacterium KA00134]UHR02519.1 Trk system potassium transporter TrkA [Peptoniphilus sp. GNH]
MKVVIVGGGKVGEALCIDLANSCDVVLIDKNQAVVENIFDQCDIQAVLGNGTDVNVQTEAGVKDADIFLAVSESDELNLVACIIAKKLGARHTMARVRNPQYSESVDFIKRSLEITTILNPEEEAAKTISRNLKFPTALNVESFAGGKLNIVELELEKESVINGLSLTEVGKNLGSPLLVCIIEREGKVFIPSGSCCLMAGDKIHVLGDNEALAKFYSMLGKSKKPISSAIMIGGGRVAYYLIKRLLQRKVDIKIIETDLERAKFLASSFPEITVINADGTDQDVLEEEGIGNYEACIALTGIDEENVILSVFAKHRGVNKSIAKVSRTSMLKILGHFGIDSIITPKSIVSDQIIRFVRSIIAADNSPVEKLYRLAGRRVEAMQFLAGDDLKILDTKLKDLKTKENTLIASIQRGRDLILPNGESKILPKDHVIVVTTQENIISLDDILV